MKKPIQHCILTVSVLLTGCLISLATSAYPKEWHDRQHYEQLVPVEQRAVETEPGKVTFKQYNEGLTTFGPLFDQNILDKDTVLNAASSSCIGSLLYLVRVGFNNPSSRQMLIDSWMNLKPLPPAYGNTGSYVKNPWAKQTFPDMQQLMVQTFSDWCEFLPDISGNQDNGLAYIQHFAWFFYKNNDAVDWVQGNNPAVSEGVKFLQLFNNERSAFMDSSASTGKIQRWIDDPRIEIEDYQRTKASDYKSWNDFFIRNIKLDGGANSAPLNRPATMIDTYIPTLNTAWVKDNVYRDYIIAAPTDCIMNPLVQVLVKDASPKRQYLENPLQENTVLDIKGIPISLVDLLKGVNDTILNQFVGGSGLACVLMPNTYHHFHAPVTGDVIHAKVVEQGTFGYPDWPNWVPTNGNVGRPGTDFSQFQKFQRGVIIIEVKYCDEKGYSHAIGGCYVQKTGYVASIPVGLDTIGSVKLDDYLAKAGPGINERVPVTRTKNRFGHFAYGGSLNILLFSKGLSNSVVQTRLGSQVGLYNVGTAPTPQPPVPQ